MFTLNLCFNFSKTTGRFSGDIDQSALGGSMNWLRLNGPEPLDPRPPAFGPEAQRWQNLKEGRVLHLRRSKDPGNVCIRIVQDLRPNSGSNPVPNPPLSENATVQLVVNFGRPVIARDSQVEASPFHENGAVKTTFIAGPQKRNSPDPNDPNRSVAWFFPLGKIPPPSEPPLDPNITDRYEFSLGIIVEERDAQGNVTERRYFGEDPEMDIGD